MRTSLTYDDTLALFKHLTKAQQNAMNHVAFSGFATSVIPSPKTLKFLEENGLIEGRKVRVGSGPFAAIIKEYSMPIPVHYLWCAEIGGEEVPA
jgi:hypothetical protein